MKVTPVSEILGAEVTGIDLSGTLGSETKAALREAFLTYQVLVIRDQTLSPAQQVAFSKIWGDLEIPANIQHTTEESQNVMILSNEIRPDGTAVGVVDGGDFWHSDSSHVAVPSMITILQSVRNPDRGGDTEFCNMYAVYAALPQDLKQKIEGQYGIHHVSKTVNKRVTISPDRPGAKDFYEAQAAARAQVIQPLVLVHPETGRKALYCSPRFTVGIKGMSEEQADPILDELFAYVTDRKRPYHYRHKYRANDLVLWDNRCLCHRAVGGYGLPDIRRMHRTVVGGDRAYADQAAS
ncbi:MAG: TauD/TfdA family dioxygenase [Proteobacteria bacterium]|nr:TauD/TfdA family dioxygenase [Pseudomonadota bacterium]MDA1324831.1 TauD/TfdA family dioxygenase [Pseudomonadota bacterium]